MHGLECFILSMTHGPKLSNGDYKTYLNFYRSDILLTLRCLLLQWRYPQKWNTIMELESHDEARRGTKYYM